MDIILSGKRALALSVPVKGARLYWQRGPHLRLYGSGKVARALNRPVSDLFRKSALPTIGPAPSPLLRAGETYNVLSLQNGATLYLNHLPSENYVAVRVTIFTAGGLSEQEGEEGLFHLLEHMVIGAMSEQPSGVTSQVATSYDYLFRADSFANHFPRILGEIFRPNFSEELLDFEIERIIEEKGVRPERTFETSLGKALWPQSRMHLSPLGQISNLVSFDLEKIRDIHERYYRGGNVRIYLSGNFDPAEARGLSKRLVPAGLALSLTAIRNNFPASGMVIKRGDREVSEARLIFNAVQRPRDRSLVLLEFLVSVLRDQALSLLKKRDLAFYHAEFEPYFFLSNAWIELKIPLASENNVPNILKEFLDILKRLRSEGLVQDALSAAKSRFIERLLARSSSSPIRQPLLLRVPRLSLQEILNIIDSLTAEELISAAHIYLNEDRVLFAGLLSDKAPIDECFAPGFPWAGRRI